MSWPAVPSTNASPAVRGCCNLLVITAASRVCLGLPFRQTVAVQLVTLQLDSMQFIMNQVAGTPQAKILWERGFFTVGSTRVLQLSLSLPEGTKLYAKFHTHSDAQQPCTEAEVYDGYMLLLPHEELTYYTNSPVGCEFMTELYAIYPGVWPASAYQKSPAMAAGLQHRWLSLQRTL